MQTKSLGRDVLLTRVVGERLENRSILREAQKGFSQDPPNAMVTSGQDSQAQGFEAWAEGTFPKVEKFSWQMREIKGFLEQGSRGYPSLARGAAQTTTRPPLLRLCSAGHSESLAKGSKVYWSQQPALPPEPGTRGAALSWVGDRAPAGRRRSPVIPGRRVGGQTSQSSAAPGSDDHHPPPDASGSVSRELAGSEAVRTGRGGHGAGLREAAAAGEGEWGGACGGGAGFGGSCFYQGHSASRSAGATPRGGVSGFAEGRSRPEGARRARGELGAGKRAGGGRPPRCQRSAVRAR